MSRHDTLVFIGPHGAGKTTIGQAVALRLGWRFDEEIGRRLREEALARDPAAHAMLTQRAFDQAVMAEELERDRMRRGVWRVVETWHPGNLAYAHARSGEELVTAYRRALDGLDRSRVLVQPLRISDVTGLARLTEPGPDGASLVAFFQSVGVVAEGVAASLGFRMLPPLHTDGVAASYVVEQVVASVQMAARG